MQKEVMEMEPRFLKVTVNSRGQPQIAFNGDWLANAGFEADMLVMARFSAGEAVFNLCDMGAASEYDLICAAKKDGYRLLRVSSCLSKGKRRPVLQVGGLWLSGFGFSTGDHIVVMAGPGSIKIKVIDTGIFGG